MKLEGNGSNATSRRLSSSVLALVYLAGVLSVVQLPQLPEFRFEVVCLLLAGVICWLPKSDKVIFVYRSLVVCFLLAVGVTLFLARAILADQLDPAFNGQTLMLTGVVTNLPSIRVSKNRYSSTNSDAIGFDARFLFQLDQPIPGLPKNLLVQWYANAPMIAAAERWQLQLRLKPPRGKLNFTGFDYERWLFRQNIGGLATVISGEPLSASEDEPQGLFGLRWRQQLSEQLENLGVGNSEPANALIRALGIADKSRLDPVTRDLFARTGTAHLLAISGLHIGLVALVGLSLGRVLLGLSGLIMPNNSARWLARISRQRLILIPAIVLALIYACLAGWSLPTQRALVMLLVLSVGVFLRRKINPWHAWSLALIGVLLLDPLSAIDPGFWLSFTAVAWLIFFLGGRRSKNRWYSMLRAQWVVVLGLLPLTLMLFSRIPVASLLANLVAIPLTGMLLVPLILLAIFFSGLWPAIAQTLLAVAAWLLDHLIAYLSWLDHWMPAITVQLSVPHAALLLLATVAVVLLLSAGGIWKYSLVLVCLLPLLLPYERLGKSIYRVEMLDVGQGLAVLVETADHLLLYDSGPGDGRGLDVIGSIVAPAITATGKPLSSVVISHGDHDHSGGLHSLRNLYPSAAYYLNRPKIDNATACTIGQNMPLFEAAGLSIEVLHPNPELPYMGNDSSCVLLFRTGNFHWLFTGDISKTVEQRLLRLYPQLRANLILVPHHGSTSSSGQSFVTALEPSIALISSGHGNRFKLPSSAVVERYTAVGAQTLDTARCGAIRLDYSVGSSSPKVTHARHSRAAIWRQSAREC
ncbi:MAG: DNA internalization-related competence protein ComEC/Rec2 [Xanthomonadales bacterium]|nr:DNA internalization-related competence protein ComEC/Rec2 [Xanthomonadales bacterium]